jgi:tetratricopeptide (TPR) repeat protein
MVSDIHHVIVKSQGGADGKNVSEYRLYRIHHRTNAHCHLDSSQVSDLDYRWIQQRTPASSVPGESPPPPPGVFFGRDELIEKMVGFAGQLISIALIGAGGIGKTSIALTVLHDGRIKQRFGDDRRFIRCDKITASLPNFLHRLSKVIGAGIENPNDLTSLRHFLSSKEMLIILDNAESILDPRGTDAEDIYAAVEELSRFGNICLCITSRITTIPSDCETLDIPTLSMESARDTFYRIYKNDERPELVSNILKQLDFHPLSITLLATVAHHNKWKVDRLTKEWEMRRTGLLHTQHNKSLAATIELSLASPTLQELGPDARDLLGVIAFFPRGVDENNLDWFFPTISNRTYIFDMFCVHSLTYRSNGFITMLAPLRDHLYPKDLRSSPLLHTTKKHYFHRLSVEVYPDKPGFDEARWITSEDINIEHLLNVFTSIDAHLDEVWSACYHFVEHLTWHKPRLLTLGPRIKGLPDDHPSKAKCLSQLAWLLADVGNYVESRQLFTHTLKLWREQGNDLRVAETLQRISMTNRALHQHKEGIQQVKEALGIYQRLDDISGQAHALHALAYLLDGDAQVDAAEEAASQLINRFSGKGEQYAVCGCYHLLGEICNRRGEREKAVNHLESALKIASSFNWHSPLFWIHYLLALLVFNEGRFDDAHTHIEQAKSYAVNSAYYLGRVAEQQAQLWYRQRKFEDARSAASHAADVYERLGAAQDMEDCKTLLWKINQAMERQV